MIGKYYYGTGRRKSSVARVLKRKKKMKIILENEKK
jgi:ribosomal protein S9